MSKILSICIPTYNMAKYLDINLNELINIIKKNSLEDKVEICISDNASIDNTQDVVKQYQSKNICEIVYNKNDDNLGADRNFLKSVEISSGEYIWLLGADDIIIKNTLVNILRIISTKEYDILLGDRLNIDLKGKEKGIQYWAKESCVVNKGNYSDFLNNSYLIGAVFSYISSIIFKKSKWESEIKKLDIEQFIGSYYIHSLILISMIKNRSKMYYLHNPIVKNRVGNDSFLNDGYFNRVKIDFNYLDIFKYLFNDNSLEYINMRQLLSRERTILHFLKTKLSVSGNKNQEQEFKSFMDKNQIKYRKIIAIIPNFIIYYLLKIYNTMGNFDIYSSIDFLKSLSIATKGTFHTSETIKGDGGKVEILTLQKHNLERGSKVLKFIDRYIGITLIFLFGIFKVKRELPKEIEKIALLKTAAIGDTTILTGIIKDIEEYNSNIQITLFTGSSNYEFAKLLTKQFKNLEVVKLTIKNPFNAIKIIRKKQFDVFLDFGSWPRLNAIFAFFSNSKYSVGFKTSGQYRHSIYDKVVLHSKEVHELQNYQNIVKAIGINENNLPQINFTKESRKDDIVVIHMFPGGSRSTLKEWPKEYWIETINYLTKNNKTVYLTGAKVDQNRAEQIKNLCKDKEKIIITAGKDTLEETTKLLSSSKLVISVDTGVMHLASALKCNLIALHGPTSFKRWGPLNSNSISLQSHLECSPCLNLGFEHGCNENKCMKSIDTSKAIESINKILCDEKQKNA